MASSRSLLRFLLLAQPSLNCPFSRPLSSVSSPSMPLSSSPSPASSSQTAPPFPLLCGRGDKKTKKGKRFKGTFGNCRPNREHRIRRIKDRWEQPPNTPWPVPGLSVEEYLPVL